MMLADWIRGIIEYLAYNEDPGSALRINPNDPANAEARDWWIQNRESLGRYISRIDMARLRRWIERTR